MKWWLVAMCSVTCLGATDISNARIQQAAVKAITVIQNSQRSWYSKRDCVSCHQQVLPALAFRSAREHGIAVDEAAAYADARAAFGFYSQLARAVEYTHVIDPALSDGYSLIAANAAGVRPSLVTAVYARLIAARQEADGRWETIDERPPQSYSPFTATAISVRAIQLYSHPSQREDVQARIGRARNWLVSHQPRATEDRVFQLRGAFWAGADKRTLSDMAAKLKATQQSDGGWSSLEGLGSDVYSTGETLVALHEAGGVAIEDPAWQRGVEYLLTTQAADGSWHVISRLHPPAPVSPPYFETGHAYGHDQFISTMGECMAIMALTSTLPTATKSQPWLKEAEPTDIEPWAETLLFGKVAEVKSLLDRGFDPNSATKSGGVTALMLAAPDTAKMKLLIESGANPDLRAHNRFSPLLVAAQYPDSAAAMNLLLDHGAQVRLPKGQGAALFNAFPVWLAAFSGNCSMIARLREQGDKLDDRMNLLGMFPVSPMLMLATSHRTNCTAALIDSGVNVDEADGDGITSLGWAAISNRIEMARLLLSRGADVNHVDIKGMTPLLYAASIDFGDSAMVDLLIQSGARTGTRTKEGLTALDLARKYKHTHLLKSLGMAEASRAVPEDSVARVSR